MKLTEEKSKNKKKEKDCNLKSLPKNLKLLDLPKKRRSNLVPKRSLLTISRILNNQELSESSVRKSKNWLINKSKTSAFKLWTMLLMTLKLKFKTTETLVTKRHSTTLIILKEKEEKELKLLLKKTFHPNK